MKLDEAKQILKEHNFIVEWGYDHYCNPFNQMNQKRIRARAELKNQLIDELIANTDYTEEDRKSLFELDVRKLKKLLKDNGIII